MIKVFFTELVQYPDAKTEQSKLMELPLQFQQKILRYRKQHDRLTGIAGKLLLKELIKAFQLEEEILLDKMLFSKKNKPYFNNNFYFNISHAKNIIVVAATLNGEIGIDVETVAPIDFSDFTNFFTKDEWAIINPDKTCGRFYECWTRKEAIIKAEGSGLELELTSFNVIADHLQLNNEDYYMQKIELPAAYKCYVAAKAPGLQIEVRELNVFK